MTLTTTQSEAYRGVWLTVLLSALLGFASISTDLYLPAMPSMGASLGALIGANTIAGGLSSVDKGTGSASALLGFAQYGGGMVGSALVSTFANGTPWPMALIICVGTLCAGTITWLMNGRTPTR